MLIVIPLLCKHTAKLPAFKILPLGFDYVVFILKNNGLTILIFNYIIVHTQASNRCPFMGYFVPQNLKKVFWIHEILLCRNSSALINLQVYVYRINTA